MPGGTLGKTRELVWGGGGGGGGGGDQRAQVSHNHARWTINVPIDGPGDSHRGSVRQFQSDAIIFGDFGGAAKSQSTGPGNFENYFLKM